MRIKGWLYLILLLCCFLSFAPRARAEERQISLRVHDSIYANNIEYTGAVDRYREGETFFGNLLRTTADVEFPPDHYFKAGILMRMPFGSSKVVDPILPVLSLNSFFLEHQLQLIAGSLYNRHRVLEAMLDNNLFYVRPAEYGLQGLADFGHWSGEAWIDWQRMESQLHNEKFDAGLTGEIK